MLNTGRQLGPYEIVGAIGAGGMGEVYRARDTKLGREVALKVLPEAFARDSERMARMRREAQVLASLNHPNIAAIYGFEDSGATHALVMELVEGPTLAERIKSGAIALEEALPTAKQICEGIEYAHERGIIHRDLKPSNVKVTQDGQVKILDFGLAKAIEGEESATSMENSPTLSAMATHAGFLLGTAAYMSPEQARGKKADRRADIWAFGVVLFEMLSGKRLFTGETTSDTLAAVIRAEPDWNDLPEQTPPRIRELLQRCLKKDARQRLQSIGDARIALEEAISGVPQNESAAAGGVKPPLQLRRQALPWAAAAVAIVAAISTGIGWWRAARPISHSMVRIDAALVTEPNYSYRLDDTTVLSEGAPGNSLAISPDGKRLAAEILDADGARRIAVRNLDEKQFKPLIGTENPNSPFFSPDGQWIAFFGDTKLRKIPVDGGAPITLCQAGIFAWGYWGDDGNIIFSGLPSGLEQIPSAGGAPTPVLGSKPGDRDPQTLPGSGAVLFTSSTGGSGNANIEVLSLKTHERKMLVQGGHAGRYVAAPNGAGYLIYVVQTTLFAAPFDLDKLAVTGTAQPMLDDLAVGTRAIAQFDISRNGTLVYLSGKSELKRAIFWLDQSGKPQPLRSEPGFYHGMRFSPDGKRLVFTMLNNHQSGDLWVQDLARNTSVRLTSLPGSSWSSVWFPDGAHIAFEHEGGIFWIRADGVGEPQELAKGPGLGVPTSFSPDGKWLATWRGDPATTVSVAPFEGTADRPQIGKPRALLQASGFAMPVFSPDGRWIAYFSAETGTPEIYVQPFPGPGGKVAVSTGGGAFPAWSHASHELFYLGRDYRIRVVDYTVSGNSFSPGAPRVWSPQQILPNAGGGPAQPYALSPDGKRFAVRLYSDGTTENHNTLSLTFLLNFADELSRRVPSQ